MTHLPIWLWVVDIILAYGSGCIIGYTIGKKK